MIKKINEYIFSSILLAIIFAILGILLIIFPSMSIKVIAYVVAGLLILDGLFIVSRTENKLFYTNILMTGILSIILGIVMLIYPKTIINMIPVFIGIWFMVSAISKINLSLVIKETSRSNWIYILIASILSMICGFLLILNPQVGIKIVATYVGVLVLVYSISDLFDMLIIKHNIDKIVNYFE